MIKKPVLLFIGCEEILKHNVKIKNGLENNFNYINCSKIKEGVSYLKKDENVVIIIINATNVKNSVSIYHNLIAKEGKYLDLPIFVFYNEATEESSIFVV